MAPLSSKLSEITRICTFGRKAWSWPIYRLSSQFGAEEKFGLVSQMRRAAVSIPSNIAEGQARNTTGEFVQFLSHAEGSAAELDTQLRLAIELEFCSTAQVSTA